MSKIKLHCIDISGKNLEEFEEKAPRWRRIKLSGTKKPADLAELVYNMTYQRQNTMYITRDGEKLQCQGHRARSIEDYFRAAKFYKKDITLKEVFDAVKKLHGKSIRPSYCGTVRRFVHNVVSYSSVLSDYRQQMGDTNIKFGDSK